MWTGISNCFLPVVELAEIAQTLFKIFEKMTIHIVKITLSVEVVNSKIHLAGYINPSIAHLFEIIMQEQPS